MEIAEKLKQALCDALPYVQDEARKYSDDGSNEPLELVREIEELLKAYERTQPASVAELQLTQSEREALNYLGSALKHKPHAEAVDRALVICDHYARLAQFTICHQKLHERMLAAPQPAKAR